METPHCLFVILKPDIVTNVYKVIMVTNAKNHVGTRV